MYRLCGWTCDRMGNCANEPRLITDASAMRPPFDQIQNRANEPTMMMEGVMMWLACAQMQNRANEPTMIADASVMAVGPRAGGEIARTNPRL